MKPEKKRKTPQVGVRLNDEMSERFDKALETTRLDSSTVVRAFIEAFCDEVEEKGGIWLPLQVVPKKKSDSPRSNALEDAPADESRSLGSTRRYQQGEEHFGHRDIGLVAEKKEKGKH